MHNALRTFTSLAQWLFTAALAVLVVRFTVVAFEPLMDPRAAEPEVAPSALPKVELREPIAAPDTARPKPAPAAITLLLMARHKQDGSNVFVNDELVGQTTFMRNISCKPGEPMQLKIAPRKGKAIIKNVLCEGATLSVSDGR